MRLSAEQHRALEDRLRAGEDVQSFLASGDAFAWLRRAIHRAERGDEGALDDVAQALALEPTGSAEGIAFVVRVALGVLDVAVPHGARWSRLYVAALEERGRVHEARRHLERTGASAQLAARHLRVRDFDRALEHARAAEGDDGAWWVRLHAAARSDSQPMSDAREEVREAAARVDPEMTHAARIAIADALECVGAPEDAARWREGDAPELRAARAERLLWDDHHDPALLSIEGLPEALRFPVALGVRVRRGAFGEALTMAVPAALADDRRVLQWLAEAHAGIGAREEALALLERAMLGGPLYLPAASVLRAKLMEERAPTCVRPAQLGGVIELLRRLDPVGTRELFAVTGERGHRSGPLVERLWAAMGGNRSTIATLNGEVVRAVGEREASRRALQLLRVRDPEDVEAELARVAQRFDGFALPLAHQGELLLWLGRVDGAEALLRRALAIERETRWPTIGLAIARLLRDDPRGALEQLTRGVRSMHGTEGPGMGAIRAEALWRMGEPRAALEALGPEGTHPGRPSATLVRALASGDAAHLASIAEADTLDEAHALLTAMRGNRSRSCPTYVDPQGRLRLFQTPAQAERTQQHRERRLALARRLVERVTG